MLILVNDDNGSIRQYHLNFNFNDVIDAQPVGQLEWQLHLALLG
jgi:hypothetical protein